MRKSTYKIIILVSVTINVILLSDVNQLQTANKELYNDNLKWNNHVVRMQYIAGIKEPDTIFKWIEKVKNPIDTKRTLKIK